MQEVFEKIIKKLGLRAEKSEKKEMDAKYFEDAQVYKGERTAFRDAIEIVRQTAAEHNNGWIPCTDRLPTPEEYQRGNGRFLVTDGNRTYEAEFDIYESHTFGKSRMATDWFVTDKCVTHWQNEPLPPKPYQPKGE